MDNNGFWQSVLLVLLSLLQQAVSLFVWEKRQTGVDSQQKPGDTVQQ